MSRSGRSGATTPRPRPVGDDVRRRRLAARARAGVLPRLRKRPSTTRRWRSTSSAWRDVSGRGLTDDRFPNSTALTVTSRRRSSRPTSGSCFSSYFGLRRAAAKARHASRRVAYWLNPAVLLDAAMLGYLDPLFVLPATGELRRGRARMAVAAGALVAAAISRRRRRRARARRRARDLARGRSGARHRARLRPPWRLPRSPRRWLSRQSSWPAGGRTWCTRCHALATHDMLSANACNLWWMVGLRRARVVLDARHGRVGRADDADADPRHLACGGAWLSESAQIVGTVLTLLAMAWALWTGRHARDLWHDGGVGGAFSSTPTRRCRHRSTRIICSRRCRCCARRGRTAALHAGIRRP